MAMTPGPLPGYYVEAITGIAQDKTTQNQIPLGNERCYIKDCVAAWLGLSIATPRHKQFSTTGNSNQTNSGRDFAIRGQRGSFQYKVLLMPLTPIPVSYYDRQTSGLVTKTIQRNSFSFSLSRTISVVELRAWLMNGAGAGEGGTIQGDAVNAIMGLVTPSLRKYIWRTPLLPAPALEATHTAPYLTVNNNSVPPSGSGPDI